MIGFVIMGLGVAGVITSTVFEIKTREPIHALLMKIFPTVFGVGCVIWSFGL